MSRLTRSLPAHAPSAGGLIGVLPGEGIGPEVVAAALQVLEALSAGSGRRFELRTGGIIGDAARRQHGRSLTEEAAGFCAEIFDGGGALFCGPGGARFVYELRERFDLYCKFTPLQPLPELSDCGALRPQVTTGVDIVAVRENIGGLYFGQWGRGTDRHERNHAFHNFEYREDQVDRILGVAARLARARSGKLCLVIKRDGVPSISELWLERMDLLQQAQPLKLEVLDIDNAVYQLIANPRQFDVIVSSNMFGDVLADTGSVLLGSRGMSYSGNFSDGGRASYQTGHGAARDLSGANSANPVGQIMALAMMLEESFGWPEGAARIRAAVGATLGAGWRTADIAGPGSRVVGTRELTACIADALSA